MMDNISAMLEEASNMEYCDFYVDAVPSEDEGEPIANYATTSVKTAKRTSFFDPSATMSASLPLISPVAFPFEVGNSLFSLSNHAWKNSERPKRPLSAYNLFFQHEREKIIANEPYLTFEESMRRVHCALKPKKRKHRKSHGKIGFAQLARIIADKWKAMDPIEKSTFDEAAAHLKAGYQVELDEWIRSQERKVKGDESKSPKELVEKVLETKVNGMTLSQPQRSTNESIFFTSPQMEKKPSGCDSRNVLSPQDTLNSLVRQASSVSDQCRQVVREGNPPDDLQNYLQMTQQTIDMARACLNLPLFAGLGTHMNHTTSHFRSPSLTSYGTGYSGCLHNNGLVNQSYDSFHEGQMHSSNHVDAMGLPFFHML